MKLKRILLCGAILILMFTVYACGKSKTKNVKSDYNRIVLETAEKAESFTNDETEIDKQENTEIETFIPNTYETLVDEEAETIIGNDLIMVEGKFNEIEADETQMRRLWDDVILNGYAQYMYPGFELSAAEIVGSGYPYVGCMLINRTFGIYIVENITGEGGNIIIGNGSECITDTFYELFDNGSVFMYDLTGDGIPELVIKTQSVELGLTNPQIAVYDIQNLKKIIIPQDIKKQIGDYVADYDMEDGENQKLIITDIDGRIYEYDEYPFGYMELSEISIDLQSATHNYICIKNGTIYYAQKIDCYVSDNSQGSNYYSTDLTIIVSFKYNATENLFELSGDYAIEKGWNYTDYEVIDIEAKEKAKAQYNEYITKY